MAQDDAYYTVEEVARTLKVTEEFVRGQIRRGNLGANKLGGEYRISRADFEDYERRTHTGNKDDNVVRVA